MILKFEDAYYQYLIYIENRQKIQSKKTLKERFENRILPFWKDYNIYDIKEIDYIKWQDELISLKFSNNYIKGFHYLMTSFFEYCIMFHNLQYNVAKKVGQFKLKNEKVKHSIYTLEEFKRFIKNVDNNIYKQFFNLMYFTGTRPGEAMALKFSDLKNNEISINKEISEHCINGVRVIDSTKSISSYRTIYIDNRLKKDLLKLKKQYKNATNDYFIFGGNKPLAPTTINRYKIKACEKAKLNPIKLHEFRHSHASLLYSRRLPLKTIQERLGHASITTTGNIYVHLNLKQEKRVQRTLNFLRLF